MHYVPNGTGRNPWANNATRHWWIGGCESGSWCCTRSAAAWTAVFGNSFLGPARAETRKLDCCWVRDVPCSVFFNFICKAPNIHPLNIHEKLGSMPWTRMSWSTNSTNPRIWELVVEDPIIPGVFTVTFVINIWFVIFLEISWLLFLHSKPSPFGSEFSTCWKLTLIAAAWLGEVAWGKTCIIWVWGCATNRSFFFSAKRDSKAVFSSEQTRQVLLLIASVGNTAGTQWCRENLAPIQSSWFSRDISGDQFFFFKTVWWFINIYGILWDNIRVCGLRERILRGAQLIHAN